MKTRPRVDSGTSSVRKSAAKGPLPVQKDWVLSPIHRWLYLFVIPFTAGLLFAILLFDVKISEGNDDSMYIEASWNYAQNFTGYFHSANAPLYPMFLGLVTKFTGLNLIVYKIINTLFYLLFLALLYRACAGRITDAVLLPVMMICATNSHLIYYASQTYTEIPFLMLFSLFLVLFFQLYEKSDSLNDWKKELIRFALPVSTIVFILTLTRNIAIGVLAGVVVFLVVTRYKIYPTLNHLRNGLLSGSAAGDKNRQLRNAHWRLAGMIVGIYLILRLLWGWLIKAVWGGNSQYVNQGNILMLKNPYNPAEGTEDFWGYISRFFENIDLYSSVRLLQILGFRDNSIQNPEWFLSLVIVITILWSAWMLLKNTAAQPAFGKHLAPLLILFAVMVPLGLSLLVLQIKWNSTRIILVYVPFLMMVLFYGFYHYLYPKGSAGRIIYWILAVVFAGSGLLSTTKKAAEHLPVLVKNIHGDKYFGYTPDWENYLRLSEWCADSLPPNSLVACRKAPMSFVYGKGRKFFPVYTAIAINPATNTSYPDSVLNYFQKNGVTHVLVGSIRNNPEVNDGIVINTLHRMLLPVAEKYPHRLKFVKQMGIAESAQLYELVADTAR